MSMVKPLSVIVRQGDTDADSRVLQGLETVHRSVIMNVEEGKNLDVAGHFFNPTGVATYYGFGLDGYYYEGGAQGRTWQSRECIDDFADLVTDTTMWTSASGNSDLLEGGIDDTTDTPFGKRLYREYVGAGAEVYDRKGLMLCAPGGANDKAVISGRLNCAGAESGTGISNSILLGLQQQASDADYVFVGFCNTSSYAFAVVMGEVVAGVATVRSSAALPVGTTEVTVAIALDYAASEYRGWYSLTPNDLDYTGVGWAAVGAAEALPAGWPDLCTPRVHVEFPASYTAGVRRSLSDIRNEVDGDPFIGDQKASWWLETGDVTNTTLAGTGQPCPAQAFCVWERDNAGRTDLTLLDVSTPATPVMWRRWQNLGQWFDWDRSEFPHWSPGWMDATEGHIVMSRNTSLQSGLTTSSRGEIWVVSLRWDRVVVFNVDGVGTLTRNYDASTGRISRDLGRWGSRRWLTPNSYAPMGNFDTANQGKTGGAAFLGTFKKIGTETIQAAVTHGVSVRRCDDDSVYIAYGLQGEPASAGLQGDYFAGVLKLDEGYAPNHTRTLFQKDDSSYTLWANSHEAWVLCGLQQARCLYWLQAGETGLLDGLEGVLSRVDFSAISAGNASSAPETEDISWGDGVPNRFMGKGINLSIQDSDPVGDEVVLVSSGWIGGSILSVLWYNGFAPPLSVLNTYGGGTPTDVPTDGFAVPVAANMFPTWLPWRQEATTAATNRCRITRGCAQGADSTYAVTDGFWSAYGAFAGSGALAHRNEVLRAPAIQAGNFTLATQGQLVTPFSYGYGLDAIDAMSANQTWECYLGAYGEKGMLARVGLRVKGDASGTGGYFAFAELSYHSSGGPVSYTASTSLTKALISSGSAFQFRIERSGSVWTLRVFDPGSGAWIDVLSQTALQCSVVGLIGASMIDSVGIGASVGMEIDSFTLAPVDDPRGQVWRAPADFTTLPHTLGSVSGGVASRLAFPVLGTGEIVVSDGWYFAGLMPAP